MTTSTRQAGGTHLPSAKRSVYLEYKLPHAGFGHPWFFPGIEVHRPQNCFIVTRKKCCYFNSSMWMINKSKRWRRLAPSFATIYQMSVKPELTGWSWMSLSYFSVSLLHFTPYQILNLQKENIQFFLGSQYLHEIKGGSFLETGIFGDHWPPSLPPIPT